MPLNPHIYAYAQFSCTCIFLCTADGGHNFGTIRDKDVIRITRRYTHPCSHELSVPELQLLDSSSSSAPSFCPPISPSPAVCETAKMSNCNAGVYDWRGMRWNRISLPVFVSFEYYSPLRREKERDGHKNLYAEYIYIRRQTCPLNDKPHAPFPSTAHAPPPFKILLSLVGYSVMIRTQGRAREQVFRASSGVCEQEG